MTSSIDTRQRLCAGHGRSNVAAGEGSSVATGEWRGGSRSVGDVGGRGPRRVGLWRMSGRIIGSTKSHGLFDDLKFRDREKLRAHGSKIRCDGRGAELLHPLGLGDWLHGVRASWRRSYRQRIG